jgi:putative glutamine amidotransferase
MPRPPLIAVSGLLETKGSPSLRLHNRYVAPLLEAGAVALAIPPLGSQDHWNALLERVDGLLLTGGDDFDAQRLGLGETHPTAVITPPEKQDQDLHMTRWALAADLPVLGICYGMQLLGIAGGAGLLQHLPEDRPNAQEHSGGIQHGVRVAPGSKLASAMGVGSQEIQVVSRHHQAIEQVPEPWVAVGWDAEGLIEAIEHSEHPFAVGVQWHPELAGPGPSPHTELFRSFIAAAEAHAATKPLQAQPS